MLFIVIISPTLVITLLHSQASNIYLLTQNFFINTISESAISILTDLKKTIKSITGENERQNHRQKGN